MNLARLVKQVVKPIVRATPILWRHILISTDYVVLGSAEEARAAMATSTGWFAERTVKRQESLYRNLIAAMKRGEPRIDFSAAAEAVHATGLTKPSLIEIGCGSGYYSDVFATLMPDGISYSGIDYSAAMIARARARYPSAHFDVGDATRLPYADGRFDITFNGAALMHIVDYPAAIREAARVASRYCILHTVPVFDDYRTTYLRKYAYGGAVVEIVFERAELLSLCKESGLRLERTWPCIPYDVSDITGHRSTTETYLFSKKE